MVQTAIIGLGSFGLRMLEELNKIDAEVIIIDKDTDIIEQYKDYAREAYITDAINFAALQKVIPKDIDAVIVDMGGKIEATIMAVVQLKKLGIKQIFAKAQSDEHGEVLRTVGATQVVFPDLVAAQGLVPRLASNVLFNYLHISPELSLAEVKVRPELDGKSLLEADIRKKYGLNIVAYRLDPNAPLSFVQPGSFYFDKNMILLAAGTEENLMEYSGVKPTVEKHNTRTQKSFLDKLLRK
jgi:trk system potassium uptake protein TrkA